MASEMRPCTVRPKLAPKPIISVHTPKREMPPIGPRCATEK